MIYRLIKIIISLRRLFVEILFCHLYIIIDVHRSLKG